MYVNLGDCEGSFRCDCCFGGDRGEGVRDVVCEGRVDGGLRLRETKLWELSRSTTGVAAGELEPLTSHTHASLIHPNFGLLDSNGSWKQLSLPTIESRIPRWN